MNTHKKAVLIGFWIVIAIIAAIIIVSVAASLTNDENTHNAEIYFINPVTNELVKEEHSIEISDEFTMIESIIEEMRKSPKNTGLEKTFPEELQVLDIKAEKNGAGKYIVNINLSKNFNNLNERKRLICRATIVWSLTSLNFVDGVIISVNGKPLERDDGQKFGIMNRKNVVLNPKISPDKINVHTVILYFSDREGTGLCAEERSIEVKQSLTLENQIVEQLIAGPENGSLFATISTETKVRNIKTEEGICYVDLSSEFVTKHNGGSSAEILTIYSIVNSLTELENVKKVQFLIEGEKMNDFKGHIDFSKPFERNDSIIIKTENYKK